MYVLGLSCIAFYVIDDMRDESFVEHSDDGEFQLSSSSSSQQYCGEELDGFINAVMKAPGTPNPLSSDIMSALLVTDGKNSLLHF